MSALRFVLPPTPLQAQTPPAPRGSFQIANWRYISPSYLSMAPYFSEKNENLEPHMILPACFSAYSSPHAFLCSQPDWMFQLCSPHPRLGWKCFPHCNLPQHCHLPIPLHSSLSPYVQLYCPINLNVLDWTTDKIKEAYSILSDLTRL